MAPPAFTATRNATAAAARKAGLPEVAAELKALRRPSAGAWLANMLVRERSEEIETLIALGDSLRTPERTPEGDDIRDVSKRKAATVSELIRHARSRASQLGQPASGSAVEELETTLDAAFADPHAATTLRQGRLTVGLQYSGLGFTAQTDHGSAVGTGSTGSTGSTGWPASQSRDQEIAAVRALDKATHEAEEADAQAEQADAGVEQARRAVDTAAAELGRLKSAEALALQYANDTHARASAAHKQLDQLR